MDTLNEYAVNDITAPDDAYTDVTLDALAPNSRGRNGATSMKTQHVCAGRRIHCAYVQRVLLSHPNTFYEILKFNGIRNECGNI